VQISLGVMQPGAPALALDYGCGWCEWARMTQAFGLETWGTELSPTRVDYAKRHGVRIVDDANLPDRAFGLVNLDQVLEHVPDPRGTLARLSKTLHACGVLRVGVPNGMRVPRSLRHFDREMRRPKLGRMMPVAPLEHLNCFSGPALEKLGAVCGLQRVRPRWAALLQITVFRPGLAAKVKAFLRPAYLRSRFSTQMYFRHAG
jgi:hypothetical protein